MYSAAWCSDCVYAKKYLDENNIHYEYIDVTNNTEATELVKKINLRSREMIKKGLISEVKRFEKYLNNCSLFFLSSPRVFKSLQFRYRWPHAHHRNEAS